MPEARETKGLAVLIDANNTSAHAQAIFDEIVKLGEASVRRIYGDFSGSRLSRWAGAIKSLAIFQHQQRSNSKGKNASDLGLVIDAMDLMHQRTLDGVVLVSSDSDFTRLAQRLREEGFEVYGCGECKAVEAFRNACNRFIYVENLLEAEPEEKRDGTPPTRTSAQKKDPPNKARKIIVGAIGEPDADGWENLASVGQRIQGAHPDIDPRSYGCPNLSTPVEEFGGFDVRKERGTVHVRRKVAARKGSGAGKGSTA